VYEEIHDPPLSGAIQEIITKSLIHVVTGATGLSGIWPARMLTIDE